jgi:hypothetical protein
MTTSQCRLCMALLLGLLVVGLVPGLALAQEPQSAALVKELTGLLEQQKLNSIAAKDPTQQDLYYAALYYPGQLLVVAARYKEPVLLNPKLAKKDYMEIYTDLNSASEPGSKVFVMDLGADGLKIKPAENQPYDSFEEETKEAAKIGVKRVTFDGDWKKQGMKAEEDYTKAFADADAKYAKILRGLLAQLKKTS